jgi:hypothetical protein
MLPYSICTMIFFYCWYVSEISHLLAMLLLFIISVYLEKNIFIIQIFLIVCVSGSLFNLCLKGSTRMYLLHVLKILWVLIKNVHKKSSILGSKFDARRRLECKMLHHLSQTPCRNTTSLCEVGDSLHQSFNFCFFCYNSKNKWHPCQLHSEIPTNISPFGKIKTFTWHIIIIIGTLVLVIMVQQKVFLSTDSTLTNFRSGSGSCFDLKHGSPVCRMFRKPIYVLDEKSNKTIMWFRIMFQIHLKECGGVISVYLDPNTPLACFKCERVQDWNITCRMFFAL